MSRENSKAWEQFMQSEYAQKEMKKEAQQFSDNRDREPLYNVDPGNKTELSKSETTQGVNAGGASMVGSEDRGPLYTTSPAACQGGAEQYADPTVEGLEDVASAMMNVAMKEPTGTPAGTQDNNPESWDGMAASGSKTVKNFTKQAQDAEPFANGAAEEEDADLESILSQLEEEPTSQENGAAPEGDFAFAAAKKKKTVALLKELVKIANECDQNGRFQDAAEIDSVIKDEVKTLLAAQKKS